MRLLGHFQEEILREHPMVPSCRRYQYSSLLLSLSLSSPNQSVSAFMVPRRGVVSERCSRLQNGNFYLLFWGAGFTRCGADISPGAQLSPTCSEQPSTQTPPTQALRPSFPVNKKYRDSLELFQIFLFHGNVYPCSNPINGYSSGLGSQFSVGIGWLSKEETQFLEELMEKSDWLSLVSVY